ncbi:unnamed protein product [Fraxinus pennsylvanica]|uniref:Cytochrome P450 n=1 Tax=Fraxinus pennsylvanica TaxID=56036 RepID=A0AAD2DJD6_9LAMI|nr:unnamed protein product [Fraxinus pennsylvanica]
MQLKFGSYPVLVASSPEMAEQFLKVHDTVFASRPALAAGKYTSYNYSNMTWAPFHEYVLDDHLAKRDANGKDFVPKDIVDVLLKLSEDPNLEDLLAGGTDTSAAIVEWTFHEIIKIPHIIEKAIEELDRVIGRERWVEENDFSKLPYMEAIIKETLRLHPVGPLLVPHFTIEDCNVSVLVASSPEMAEQFLKVHDTVFASRPALAAGKLILLREQLSRYSLSIITRMVLSNKYFSESKCDDQGSIITLDELQGLLD